MNLLDKVNYWIELAEYDLETAKVMLKSKRLLYVGFMCHQAIEKITKGYFEKYKATSAPYTHNISKISKEAGLYDFFNDEQLDLIDLLDPMNVGTRYPQDKAKLEKSLTEEKCKVILQETEVLLEWIKNKL